MTGPRRSRYRRAFPQIILIVLIALSTTAVGGGLFAEDTPRESAVCLNCHEGQDATLAKTAHRLPGDDAKETDYIVACTDCHSGGRAHWEDDPAENAMGNPAKLPALAAAHVCSSCHQNAHQQNMLAKNVHTTNDVNCSACHSVHGSEHPALLKESETGLCISCHGNVEGQFAKPYRHPVNDGIVACSECHVSVDKVRGERALDGTNMCTTCHAEFEGPFPYEHQAAVHYSVEEGGCLTCHEAHGSHLPRMLKQPYEAPHFQLCTQCHSVPRHNSNTKHGTDFAGVSCSSCHSDVHGSYTSRKLLSETLEGQGCLKAGCHGQ